jgi:hypothetical protein
MMGATGPMVFVPEPVSKKKLTPEKPQRPGGQTEVDTTGNTERVSH